MAGQMWSSNGAGGYLANPRLSRTIRHASQPLMKFRQFVKMEPGYGKGKSDRILFDRIANVTNAGGQLTENARIPETDVVITQGSIIVAEWGNAIPFTGKLETLSEFSVDNIVTVALRNDMAKVLDDAVADEFKTCQVKLVPTGTVSSPTVNVTTNGTAGTTATRDVGIFDIKEAADYLKQTLKAEKYDGDNYIAIGSTSALRKIKDSSEWQDAAKYGDPDRLFAGEVGRFYGVRFIEETNTLLTTLVASGAGSSYGAEMLFFGADATVEGVALPEEVRAKIPEDYGRSKGIAWYALLGWSLTYDTGSPGEAKIVHITSA